MNHKPPVSPSVLRMVLIILLLEAVIGFFVYQIFSLRSAIKQGQQEQWVADKK